MKLAPESFALGLVIGASGATVALLLFSADPARPQATLRAAGPEEAAPVRDERDAAEWLAPPGGAERSSPDATSTKRVDPGAGAALVSGWIEREGPAPAATEPGPGVIHGRVAEPSGRGLAGVVVRARATISLPDSASPEDIGAGAPPLDLREAVQRAVEQHRTRNALLFETRSDASGAYRLEGLPDERFTLSAYLPDWWIEALGGESGVAIGSQVDFRARPVQRLEVAVFLPSGESPDSAVVHGSGGGLPERDFTWSPGAPHLRLPPGRYELRALAGATPSSGQEAYDLRSEPKVVDVVAGVEAPALRFDLVARAGVRGRVLVPRDGVIARSSYVRLVALGPGGEPDLDALAESGQREWVGPSGDYAFLDLQPGRYVVGAARSGAESIEAHAVVEIRDGVQRCDLALPDLDRGRCLTVTVRDESGHTLDNVAFQLWHRYAQGSSSSGRGALRTSEGEYLLVLDRETSAAYFDEGTDHEFALEVSHERYGRRSIELEPGRTRVDVSFSSAARLEVTVLGYGQGLAQGRLSLYLRNDAGRSASSEDSTPASDGTAIFEAVEPGTYTLELSVRWRPGGSRWDQDAVVHSQPVTLAPGPNAVAVALPALHEVVVSFPEGEAGTPFQLAHESEAWGRRSAELDGEGRAVFSWVPGGRYRIQCPTLSAQMEIDVPCGVVAFEPRAIDALRVRIVDTAGALAALGFRDGDLIVGLEGEDFESLEDAYRIYRSRVLTLAVLRGGARIELSSVKMPQKLYDEGAVGGRLEPACR